MALDKISDIDLILLTYNREDTVARALSSVASRKFNKVVCVDHFSKDNTVGIVKNFYPQCKVLYENKGLGYARTLAIEQVESPFFFFLDSDVVVPPDFFQTIIKYLSPHIGAIQGKRSMQHEFWGPIIRSRIGASSYRAMKPGDRPFTGATLVRTEAARGANLSRYKMWEDYFLLRHMQSKGYFWLEVFIPVTTLEPRVTEYGNLRRRSDETEGAAMRSYGIKQPVEFFMEQLKFTLRDLSIAIKLGNPKWISYAFHLHKSFIKGYISPKRYLAD